MVPTSRKIQQSIEQLQQQTIRLGDELQALYERYFDVLSDACQRQLVLAAYHICTQVYPESFLELSYSQREKLQKTLQQLGNQIREQLQERWEQAQQASQQPLQDDGLALIKQLFLQAEAARAEADSSPSSSSDSDGSAASSLSDADAAAGLNSDTSESDSPAIQPFEKDLNDWLSLSENEASESAESESIESESAGAKSVDDDEPSQPRYRVLKVEESESGTNISFVDGEEPSRASLRDRLIARLSAYKAGDTTSTGDDVGQDETDVDENRAPDSDKVATDNVETKAAPPEPTQLLRLQLFTEKAIRDVLKTVSETANYLLQQEKIIPEMPKALLAAAAESDGLSQTPMKTPNLLKISVRVLHDSDEEDVDEDADEGDADDAEALDDSLASRLEQMLKARVMDEATEDEGEDDEKSSSNRSRSNRASGNLPRIVQIESLPEFIVIHLRLSEVEFADPHTAAQRRQIRAKMNDLKKLGRVYKKAQRQLAIAQAEDAWRSSWIE